MRHTSVRLSVRAIAPILTLLSSVSEVGQRRVRFYNMFMQVSDLLSPLALELAKKPSSEAALLIVSSSATAQMLSLLKDVSPAELLKVPVCDARSADALLAGLWLGHDALDEGHHLAQNIDNTTGAFWHAIMHRREGDFSNAKYWYARCRAHPVNKTLAPLAEAFSPNAGSDPLLRRLTCGDWDANAFVDLVEAVHRRPADARYAIAASLQQLEWRTLFEHCAMIAAGEAKSG